MFFSALQLLLVLVRAALIMIIDSVFVVRLRGTDTVVTHATRRLSCGRDDAIAATTSP